MAGVVHQVSPMKQPAAGRNLYFEGQLSDETGKIWIVGFNQEQQQKLLNMQETATTVTIENCEIKKARYSDCMEAIITQSSQLDKSPRTIIPMASVNATPNMITELNNVPKLDDFTQIAVIIKVTEVCEKHQIKTNLWFS